MFYMNYGALNEGEQADAYKKKKADEKAAQDAEDKERNNRRYDPEYEYRIGSKAHINPSDLEHPVKMSDVEKFHKDVEEDMRRNSQAHDIVAKDNKQRYGHHSDASRYTPNYMQRKDAVNKHMRRHPEAYKEEGIFAEASFMDE